MNRTTLSLLSAPLFSIATQAAIITVGQGPGFDQSTVTAALAAGATGDIVRVAPGTYSKASGEVFPLVIDKPVTLEWATPGQRPWIRGDDLHSVVLIASAAVTVRGFRITDGLGSEGIYGMDGGGVCVFVDEDASGSVRIEDCVIEDNTCPFDETYDGSGAGIYCGGTWCTCFEIGILRCEIRNNRVKGNGGGVFCGLLSKVWMEDCLIDSNVAEDRGGGVFVDTFALAMLKGSQVRTNDSPGDTTRVGWGGKGGGVFLHGDAVCALEQCQLVGNTARYYGGGVFTMSAVMESVTGSECPGASHPFFTMPVLSNLVTQTLVEHNAAGLSGGGAYVRDDAYLAQSATTNYWNDAGLDGGAIFVGSENGSGGKLRLMDGCLLEGNECVRRGGGVALGPRSVAQLVGTRFLGNTSGEDGGALHQDPESQATLANCLLTYNNAARGRGAGLRLGARARADLNHCSVVGNFAPWDRSGAYLFEGAVMTVTNSILWRNAGGSVQVNGATFEIGHSLNEDAPAPLTGNPGYVAWGTRSKLAVASSAHGPGSGADNEPFPDLQVGLDAFDFRLAANSPCLGTASDGGDMGALTGRGGQAGNIVVSLEMADGTYPIRGRNVAMIRGLQGTGTERTLIRHTVFGYIEDAWVRDLSITGEDKFGGIVIRADAAFERCRVHDNGALGDGGGVLIAEGHSTFTEAQILANTSAGRGGGLYVSPGLQTELQSSAVERNRSVQHGGGVFLDTNVVAQVTGSVVRDNLNNWNNTYAAAEGGGIYAAHILTLTIIDNSAVDRNGSTSLGGGLRLGGTTFMESSCVRSNTAAAHGGGIYLSGYLTATSVTTTTNGATGVGHHGGGLYIAKQAVATITTSLVSSNWANGDYGGGICCYGEVRLDDTDILSNSSGQGGGMAMFATQASVCERCRFVGNSAGYGGGVGVWEGSPRFIDCDFQKNITAVGGAVHANGDRATFDGCAFSENIGKDAGGAVQACCTSGTAFFYCNFSGNSARVGGTIHFNGAATSRFVDCTISAAEATDSGGALYVDESARPLFQHLRIENCRATRNGGGIACVGEPCPLFEDLVVTNCTAVLGGGLYAEGGTNSFTRSWFTGNRAQSTSLSADGGGANLTKSAVGHFTDCWFGDNTATDDGGGFAVADRAAIGLTNVYLVNNTAVNTGGGAYFTANASGRLQNCTVSGNRANPVGGGGGIYHDENSGMTVDSSVIHGNVPDGVAHKGGILAVTWSCLQEASTGTGNLLVDPLLDSTGLFLLDGSAAIDAGNPAPALNDLVLPPGKGTLRNDMGATGGPMNGWTRAAAETLWIPTGGLWSYFNVGAEPDGDWRAVGYDDSNWRYGVAKFGYGGDGEATVVDFGADSAQKFVTTYFRRTMSVSDLAAVTRQGPLELRLQCDDGAVVYVNGREAARYNLAPGPLGYHTLASSDVLGADENRWLSFPLDPRWLAQGPNVIAVEVHQFAADSGDLGFDLEIASRSSFTARPRKFYVNDDSTAGDVFTSGLGSDGNNGRHPGYPLRLVSTVFARNNLQPGDVIYVDAGIYPDAITVPSGVRGLTLIGAGRDISTIDAGPRTTNCLVLDHVSGLTIRDLTLRNGNAKKSLYGALRGGALSCSWSDLYATNVALRNSTAQYGGGAWVDRSDVVLDNVLCDGNVAENQGGGLFLDWTESIDSRHLVTNCVVTGNRASDGGGLYVIAGLVQGCMLSANLASVLGGGGGVFLERSRVEACVVTTNRAQYAGGLYLAHQATLRDCRFENNTANGDGGGLQSWSSTPISNCVFTGNSAVNSGGGANLWESASVRHCVFAANRANWAGGLTVDGRATALNCTFTNNAATIDGGGFRAWNSASASNCFVAFNTATETGGGANAWGSAVVRNCTFAANRAKWAGGLSIHETAKALDCALTNNTASIDGGGFRAWNSASASNCFSALNIASGAGGGANAWDAAKVLKCTFAENHGNLGGGLTLGNNAVGRDCVVTNNTAQTDGGGVYLWDTTTLSDCTIVANTSVNKSGGGVYGDSKGFVQNCRISNNTALGFGGGGLYLSGKVRGSLIHGNTGNYGGGLFLLPGAGVENCTVAGNIAGKGGGLYLERGSLITVSNSIIYFNQSINGSNYFHNNATHRYSHCCTAPALNAIALVTADPWFRNWEAGDFRLTAQSPCIDAGLNATWMSNAFDLEGYPRVVNNLVDLGAYEFLAADLDTDADGLPDGWERQYFQSPIVARPEADSDGDGSSNLAEYIAGTDPTNASDCLRISAFDLNRATGQAVISWDSKPGRLYTVYAVTELSGPWTKPVYEVAPAAPARQRYTTDMSTADRFFRVGVRILR